MNHDLIFISTGQNKRLSRRHKGRKWKGPGLDRTLILMFRDSPFGSGSRSSCLIDLGVMTPWCDASYLHGSRSGENYYVGSFPSWFQHHLGHLLDPNNIAKLKQEQTGCRFRGQLFLSARLMDSLYGGLEGLL